MLVMVSLFLCYLPCSDLRYQAWVPGWAVMVVEIEKVKHNQVTCQLRAVQGCEFVLDGSGRVMLLPAVQREVDADDIGVGSCHKVTEKFGGP